MNKRISPYLVSLVEVEWQNPNSFEYPNERTRHWLEEQGSLSRRLSQTCQDFTVSQVHNHIVKAESLSSEESQLLSEQDCLLREVILRGDEIDWIIGRTLIPNSTLIDQQYDFSQQGEVPLGVTVFSAANVERDALQVGWAYLGTQRFLARRSRLWMNHKPMLVAELFLPSSPIYIEDSE